MGTPITDTFLNNRAHGFLATEVKPLPKEERRPPTNTKNLKICPTLKKLIPPLSERELSVLENSLLEFGCQDAIKTWENTVLDGHHRYTLCHKHGLSFKTEEMPFESKQDVEIWMLNNQFGRRNLTDFIRGELALALKARLREKAEKNSFSNNRYLQAAKKEGDNECSNLNTRRNLKDKEKNERRVDAQVAKVAGIGTTQIYKIEKLKRSATPEEIEELRRGKVSIHKKYVEKQTQERRSTLKNKDFPKGKYRVIYADPPWQYQDKRAPGNGGADRHYPTMALEEICNLPVKSLAEENAVLFLWATTPLIQEGLDVMKAWGFTYKTLFTWDKKQGFFGHYNAVGQEFLLLGIRGSCLPDSSKRPYSVIREQKGRHSEKPKSFRGLIESMYKYGNKLELFARKKEEGWEAYGNEV